MMGGMLIITGIILVIAGLVVMFGDKIPLAGKLPGDVSIETKNGGVYFPVVTCIVASVILSVLMNVVFRLFDK